MVMFSSCVHESMEAIMGDLKVASQSIMRAFKEAKAVVDLNERVSAGDVLKTAETPDLVKIAETILAPRT